MTSTREIHRPYREAGALHTLIHVRRWVDEAVFQTEAGGLGLLVTWPGVDYEGLDPVERDAVARRFERALRLFDERFRVYQYLVKERLDRLPTWTSGVPVADDLAHRRERHLTQARGLYTVRLYVAIVYEGWRHVLRRQTLRDAIVRRSPRALRAWLSPTDTASLLHQSRQDACAFLRRQVHAWCVQLGDLLAPRLLDRRDAFRVLRRLVNYTPGKAERVSRSGDRWLDYAIGDCHVDCYRSYLTNDDLVVRVLTLKTPPDQTFAHLLQPFYELPFPVLLVSEWRREGAGATRREIQAKRRHHHNRRHSMLSYLSGQPPAAGEVLVDDGATARVHALGRSLEATEMEGVYFGWFSLTVVVYADDLATLEERVSACQKVFTVLDDEAALLDERANLLHAWAAILPGGHVYNKRYMYLPNTAYADLSVVFGLDHGDARNAHLQQPALAVFETAHRTAFHLNCHVADVGHTLLLGATGSGKSFLANLLIAHALRYRPRITIFDLGGSYARLVRHFEGQSLRLTLDQQACTINPFAHPPTADHLQFLSMFVRLLIEGTGQYALSTADDRDLYEQIANLYELEPAQRRLSTLAKVLRRPLGDQLQRWVAGGPYGAMFDHETDTLAFASLQLIDLHGLERYPQLLQALFFYLLQRAALLLDDDALVDTWKLFVIEEAWESMQYPPLLDFTRRLLKRARKRNGSLLLVTPSSEDLVRSTILQAAVESSPTRLFMANPNFDREAYRTTFHLSDATLDQLATLTPRHEVLLTQPDRTKVLTLSVDPESAALYRTDPLASPDAPS